jgi:hypothetical protein
MFSQRGLLLGIVVALCVYGGWNAWSLRSIERAPGVLAQDEPQQENYDLLPPAFDHDGYAIQPLARFSLLARVLSRSDYHLDRLSGLIPTDLALGWGPMSDSAVLPYLEDRAEQPLLFLVGDGVSDPAPGDRGAQCQYAPDSGGCRRAAGAAPDTTWGAGSAERSIGGGPGSEGLEHPQLHDP